MQKMKHEVGCIFHVHKNLYIASCSVNQAKKLMLSSLKSVKFVTPNSEQLDQLCHREYGPSTIIHMYVFCLSLNENIMSNPGKDVVVCAGQCQARITNTALLLGSYLILHQGLSPDQVQQAFVSVQDCFIYYSERSFVGRCTELLSVQDCWTAVFIARSLSWVDFGPGIDFKSPMLDMDEYAHYDDPVNGSFHLAIPSKFILFNCPVDLPPARRWVDVDGVRDFSPAYYADLFASFGVTLVVRAAPSDYDPCPFTARGIAVEDIATPSCATPADAAGSLLRTADRLRTLARATDGLIAIHGDSSGDGGHLGPAAAALASYLVSQHGFPAKAAVAWLRIAARLEPGPPAAQSAASDEDRRGGRLAPRRKAAPPHLALHSESPIVAGGRRWRAAASAPTTPTDTISPARPSAVRRTLWH
jgi:hypothetical protein